MLKLWLDDIRHVPDSSYVHVHSVNEAISIIKQYEDMGETDFLLDCDHDLGEYAYDGGDGIKLLDWLAETGRHYKVVLHTMNIVGRQNMERLINRYSLG